MKRQIPAADGFGAASRSPVRTIRCDDGFEISAASDDELVSGFEAHFRAAHRELAGVLSKAEILAMAEVRRPSKEGRGTGGEHRWRLCGFGWVECERCGERSWTRTSGRDCAAESRKVVSG